MSELRYKGEDRVSTGRGGSRVGILSRGNWEEGGKKERQQAYLGDGRVLRAVGRPETSLHL